MMYTYYQKFYFRKKMYHLIIHYDDNIVSNYTSYLYDSIS